MKIFTRLSLSLIFIILAKNLSAQDIPGYNTSNYAGVSGIDLQPASIADMRYKFDMTLVGVGFDLNNNYIGAYSQYIRDRSIFNNYPGDFQTHFLTENTNSTPKEVGLNMYAQLPSFAVSLSKNISIGFTWRIRSMMNIDNVSPQLAHLMYTGLNESDKTNLTYFNVQLNNDQFNINQMTWNEYGFDYAQVIVGKGPNFLKIGGRVKIEDGLEAAYLYATNLEYKWKNSDTLSLFNSHFTEGQTQNLLDYAGGNTNIFNALQNVSSTSLAFDIGAVYEWRPDYSSFIYDMDGQKNIERRDKSKYKLRIGASVLDIGSITFQKGNSAIDFAANQLVNWPVNKLNFGANKLHGFDSIIKSSPNVYNSAVNNFISTDSKSTFVFALPTTFSVQVDYNIYKDLYLNFTSSTSPHWLNVESQVHTLSYYTLTPRWDNKWFGLFIPVGINGYGQTTFGATVRLGPFIVGTSNGLNVLLSKQIYGLNAYAAVKIPILYGGPPRDRDHDGVSDKYDMCPDKPGTWAHHGCPDSDGDGVYDDVDQCPTIPGPPENHGCPWPDRDSDGVIDKLDSCPDVKGPVANHGCPWGDADHDGVPDNLDSCPHVAGPAANHGCPWGDADNDGVPDNLDSCPHIPGPAANHGCPWGDADNDGVPDNLDSCPHTPGPASNHGCPVLAKKTQEVVNTAFHNLEFELGKAVILSSSFSSLDDLAALLKKHPDFKLRLSGYTDNVGSVESNFILSKDRAMAVHDALINRGVDPGRMVVEWHGQADPVAPNTTEAGRAKNRRVEMKIIFD